MKRHALTDEQWVLLAEFFPPRVPKAGGQWKDDRLMLDGILWRLNTGAGWRDLPDRFGPWQTVYDRFNAMHKQGLLDRVFVDEWVAAGGRNAADLHRLLEQKGFRVSYNAVLRYVNPRIGSTGRQGRRPREATPRRPPVPSARKLSFQFINPPKAEVGKPSPGATEPRFLDRLRANIPGLAAALDVASELRSMLRKEVTCPLSDWLARAERPGVGELRAFAKGLREDEAAVPAALTEAWSNGQVEGQVNRLKFIKRSMYGRAGWRLLRARVKRRN